MAEWLKDAVFYEIYPQSFQDTNADGIGDFQGIIDRLDYIKELGCNAIWMNPCFESPFGDAGYDVSDYYTAAPRYGTNGDLKRLFDEVHKRGMHILLDLVPGHTSVEQSIYRSLYLDRQYLGAARGNCLDQGYFGQRRLLRGKFLFPPAGIKLWSLYL